MIQSVLFHQEIWTLDDAIKWLDSHGFIHPKVDESANYLRFRQAWPMPGSRYTTVDLGKGIKMIMMN